jgi:hypothetical protein
MFFHFLSLSPPFSAALFHKFPPTLLKDGDIYYAMYSALQQTVVKSNVRCTWGALILKFDVSNGIFE